MSAGRAPQRRDDLALALFLAAFFLGAIVLALGFPSSQVFPLAIAVPGLALSLLQAVTSLRGADTVVATVDRSGPAVADDEAGEDLPADVRVRRTVRITAWVLGTFALVWLIGFQWTFPVLALGYLRLESRESWLSATVIAVLCFLFVWGVFDQLLHVPLPPGVLVGALGRG